MTPWWQQYPEDLSDPMRDDPEPPEGMMVCPNCDGGHSAPGGGCKVCAGTGAVSVEGSA